MRSLLVLLCLAACDGDTRPGAGLDAGADAQSSSCLDLCRPCRDVGAGVEAVQACVRACFGWSDAGTPPPLDTVCGH